MKYRSFIPGSILTLSSFFGLAQDRSDPVKIANEANEKKIENKIVNEDVAEFLVKSSDARMMDSKEGKLAVQKGTNAGIQNYGSLMVKDQAMLLKKIKELATKRQITLPADISNDKHEGHEDLQGKTGEDFDKKFIKMMILDHERDIKIFKKATEYDDSEISNFAKKYLPLIQSHLDKIKAIKG